MKKKLIELPEDLFNSIAKNAELNDRSVNKQIVYLLKQGLKHEH